MKKKTLLICSIMMILLVTSCRKGYFDINTDPDAATTVDPVYLLNNSAGAYTVERMAEVYGTRLYTQMWLGGDYNYWEDEIFIVSPYTTNNFWSTTYTDALTNAQQALEMSKKKFVNPKNAVAQINVWKAFIYYNTTMLWEDVPFSEVGQIETNSAPHYDSQKDVFNGILGLLDEAIADLDVSNTEKLPDPWFRGDITKWIKLARSLKLKVLMTMVDADPSKATDIGNLIDAGGMMTSAADNWKFQYLNESGKKNPIWYIVEKYYGSTQEAWLASNVVLDILQSDSDPRLEKFYTIGDDASDYIGIDPFEPISDRVPEISYVSTDIINGGYPDYMHTFAEQELLIAEAIQRGFASGDANAKYLSGVDASLKHYGVAPGEASAFISTLADLTSLSSTDALEAIHKQQYLNLFDRTIEPWNQWRRTEYPALTIPLDASLSDIIRRYQYSPTELSSNPNAKPNKPLDTKMWFDL
ncbi:MAG TPA: SusD/RagB family nutrient-binding outer membrane lipoprotein [Chitinophagales bacterium]|nr:SusD/RagB family nutrient-binding outer membrane lipoprotein [Chitinophagales bacterium]HNM67171.1 SusD/RagB family nutrient-binding outer membrane lipoprotein [Chitinophagales bacterium]